MATDVANPDPKMVAMFTRRIKVKIYNPGPGTIFFAPTKTELVIQTAGDLVGGLPVAPPNPNPFIPEWEWEGELWVIGSQANCRFVWVAPGWREAQGHVGTSRGH